MIAADAVNNTGTASRSFAVVVPPAVIPAITGYTGYQQTAGDYTMGYTFRVTRAATLAEVGIQDTNNDGVLNNATDTPFSRLASIRPRRPRDRHGRQGGAAQSGWFYGKLADAARRCSRA